MQPYRRLSSKVRCGQGYVSVSALTCPALSNCTGRSKKARRRNPNYGDFITKRATDKTKGDEFGEYISQTEAARIIGVTKQTMSKLVRKGRFTTRAAAGRALVLRIEAEAYVARSAGRPTKEAQAKSKTFKRRPDNDYKKDSAKYVSQAEAARIRKVSQTAIANLIRRGRLKTVSAGGRVLVLRTEVEAFVPQPVGHPPKEENQREDA
jgi:predicted DNA-binding protein (UPF0251 family)